MCVTDAYICVGGVLGMLLKWQRTVTFDRGLYAGVSYVDKPVLWQQPNGGGKSTRWRNWQYPVQFKTFVYPPYMQGGVYILSQALAGHVTSRSASMLQQPAKLWPTCEDSLIGELVHQTVQELPGIELLDLSKSNVSFREFSSRSVKTTDTRESNYSCAATLHNRHLAKTSKDCARSFIVHP